MADTPAFDPRAKLLEHFKGRENQPGAWDDLWKGKDFLPWDRLMPNPALVDILNDRTDLIGSSMDGGRRKKALVPGCGRGYDCVLLASYGYDAYGLEGSENAIEEAKKWQQDHQKEYEVKDEAVGRGQVKFVSGDFFKSDWEKDVPGLREPAQNGFDIIYDYTVGLSTSSSFGRGKLICLVPIGAPAYQQTCLGIANVEPSQQNRYFSLHRISDI